MGGVIAAASNQRWSSDGLEIACWNGEVVRVIFAIDTHDREIIVSVIPLARCFAMPAYDPLASR
jgi:hypothetical protein